MLRLLALAGLLVALAPAAHAQEGGATDSPATVDGQPAPVLDYTRFLKMRYWPQRGMFYLGEGKDHLLFPPEGFDPYADNHGEYVIRNAEGREVASQRLGSFGSTRSAAFLTVGTYAGPSGVETLEPGSYTLDLVFHGRIASRIPFSITAHEGGDPFDPKTIYQRSGPWSQLAYFEHETERTDYHLTFNTWVSADDLGADGGRVRFTLYRDGQPVAANKNSLGPHVSTEGDWGHASTYLVTYETRDATNPTFFTIADMTPGSYVMRVSPYDSEEVLREFAFEGGAGTIAPHERSAADYEPRYSYLNPRRMGGSSLNKMYSVYWVEATE